MLGSTITMKALEGQNLSTKVLLPTASEWNGIRVSDSTHSSCGRYMNFSLVTRTCRCNLDLKSYDIYRRLLVEPHTKPVVVRNPMLLSMGNCRIPYLPVEIPV